MPRRKIIAPILLSLLLSSGTRADQVDDALNKFSDYAAAMKALAQNKNEVAADHLGKIQADQLTKPAKLRLLTRMAEAEVRAGNHVTALTFFEEPGLATDPQAKYWQGVALLGSGRPGDARTILEQVANDPTNPQQAEASLTLTSILLRFGEPAAAIKTLEPLLESENKATATRARLRAAEILLSMQEWEQADAMLTDSGTAGSAEALQIEYLRARSSIGKKDWPTALAQFRKLNDPDLQSKLPGAMPDGVVLGLTDALQHNDGRDEAVDLLRSFITTRPDSPNLAVAFEQLRELGVFDTDKIDESLETWAESSSRNLAATATYFLAVAQIKAIGEDAAAATLETIRADFKDHPIAEKALLHLSEIYVANANKSQALAALEDLKRISTTPAVRSRIEFIEAYANFAAGDFKDAADKFAESAKASPEGVEVATYNAAISAIKEGDIDAFNKRTQILAEELAPPTAESLRLERAIYAARLGAEDADKLLETFLTDYPQHPRRAEAHLALAYLQINQDFPKIVSARKHLEEARQSPISPILSEEADYIAFWIEIAANDNAAAITTGEQFTKNHPGSARAPEILFKLGAIHFRDGLFPAAQTHFERLAIDYPASPRAEIALFTAGRAAMRTGTPTSTENAIDIFERVAELGGEFATSAKLQQAMVRRTQLDETKAIPILDSILEEKPTGELLFSTLVAKGESLFVLGEEDPTSLTAAAAVFDSVAKHPDVTNYWYNQSLTRKGKTLERLGKPDEALAAYEAVISQVGEEEPDDYVWFYKAGFAAIRLYEERENWKAAIATADILASKNGPGAQAARERSTKIETKNFIWRD